MKRMMCFLLVALLATILLPAEQTQAEALAISDVQATGIASAGFTNSTELIIIADVATTGAELVAIAGAAQNMMATMAIIDVVATKNAWSAPTAMTLASVQNDLYRLNMTTPARGSPRVATNDADANLVYGPGAWTARIAPTTNDDSITVMGAEPLLL